MQKHASQIDQAIRSGNFAVIPALATGLALFAGLLFSANTASAQTLMFRFPFDNAHSTSSSTTSDGTGALDAISGPLSLGTYLGTGNGTAPVSVAGADLRGPANSGVQGQGEALKIANSPNPAFQPSVIAFVSNSIPLAAMGDGLTPGSIFSNFTATVWFKMSDFVASPTDTQGGVLWFVGQSGLTSPGGSANTIAFRINSRAGANNGITNTFLARIGTAPLVAAPLYFNTPTNLWMYFAVVYNATNQNAYVYYGTEAGPARLVGIKNIGALTFNFGAGGRLDVGNLVNGGFIRHVDGLLQDLRFYTGANGAANAAFVEAVRRERTPVVISGLYPDGTSLLQGTNRLAFTASSANGINPARISVAVNGTDVSGSLVIGGTSTARTISYTGLPVNPGLAIPTTGVPYPNLNLATISLSVTDSNGIATTNAIFYDAFSPTNFTWEAEDYDFSYGQFIDNPAYSFISGPTTYINQPGSIYYDYSVNISAVSVYRPSDLVPTEYSLAAAVSNGNGNGNVGELMRDKVLAALAVNAEGNESIRDVDVNNYAAGNWANYTRTYPTGVFNIYLRGAAGGAGLATLSRLTSGWGQALQTTSFVGTFGVTNSGGPEAYAWIPLNDTNGAPVAINLGGTNTFELTAGINGAGTAPDMNFFMLVPRVPLRAPLAVVIDNATNTVLSFTSQPGVSYQVQFKNSLTNAMWTPLNAVPLPGTGTTLSVTNFGPITSRFYRLLIQ